MFSDQMNGGYFMNGMGYFGPVMMIFWLAVIIALAVFLVRWLGGSSTTRDRSDAMDVLRQRFANGDIDAAEFEDRKRKLEE